MFDLKQVAVFVELTQHMHFGRAAQALGISQPSLSLQIRSLEEQTGGPLINRSNRTMTLTALGESFLADAKQMMAMVECSKRNNAEILSGARSRLNLGVCPGVISSGLFRRLLHEIRRLYPQATVHTVEAPPATLQKSLDSGKIDIMLAITFGLALSDGVLVQPVAQWQMVLAASKAMKLTRKDGSLDLDRVREQTFIHLEFEQISPHVAQMALRLEPKRTISLSSIRLLTDYVDAGYGIAIVPRVDESLAGSNTVFYPIPAVEPMNVQALRLPGNRSMIVCRVFRLLGDIFGQGQER